MKKGYIFKFIFVVIMIILMVYSYFIDSRIREVTLFYIVIIFGWLSMQIYDEIKYKKSSEEERTKSERKIDWAILVIVCINALDVIRSIMLYGIT